MSDEQAFYFKQIQAINPALLDVNTANGDLASTYWSLVNSGKIPSPVSTSIKSKPVPGLRWIFIGDSITYGSSASNYNYSYGPKAIQTLGAFVGRFDFFNAGVAGNNSANVLARLNNIIAAGADAAVLMIGTNDAFQNISVSTYISNVTAIITNLRAAGLPVILCTISARTSSGSTASPLIRAYNTWIRLVGPTLGCTIADMYAATVDITSGALLSSMDSGDGLHPNDTGHNAMAKELMNAMIKATGISAPVGLVKTGLSAPDISNLVQDPLAQGGGTQPTGWSEQAGGTGTAPTYSLVADTSGVLPAGKWAQMDFDGTTLGGNRRLMTNTFDTSKWSVGDRLLMTAHIQIEDTSGTWETDVLAGNTVLTPNVVNQSSASIGVANNLFRIVGKKNSSGFYDISPFVSVPFTVPVGTTAINARFELTIPTGKHYKLRVGAVGVLNLTKLGLDTYFNSWSQNVVNVT